MAETPPPLLTNSHPARRETSIPLTIGLLVVAYTFLAFVILIVPRFEMIFSDFHTDLPWMTKLLLDFERAIIPDFLWVIPPLLAGALPIVLVRLTDSKPLLQQKLCKWRTAIWISLCLLLALVIFAVAFFIAPTVSLLQSVSSPSKR